ncbi:hypothetical protein [Nannocystis pusilla]|uniref:hypothetical protein n=1 Tax=Nannocystis pusilla TaxID=889268 RepID=UPI003B7B555B
MAEHPYAEFLGRVEKPGRYLGGEEQQIRKSGAGLACRFVLAFPDLYEIGMSHLGTRILYDLVNGHADLVCERAFSPWTDMEAELRARGLPLVSLETATPLREFDVVGFSLQYELSYTNVLLNLDLGGIPLRSADRGEADPIVLAGGPTATHPEPLAPFVDLFLVGEAEEVLPELLRTIGRMRREVGRGARSWPLLRARPASTRPPSTPSSATRGASCSSSAAPPRRAAPSACPSESRASTCAISISSRSPRASRSPTPRRSSTAPASRSPAAAPRAAASARPASSTGPSASATPSRSSRPCSTASKRPASPRPASPR